jgi:site-specific recombinase XerD
LRICRLLVPPLLFRSNLGSGLNRAASQRLVRWVRGLSILPTDIDPNHGWRHRFKTQVRELGIDARVADAIQGHAARTAGKSYSDVTLKAKKAAIDKLPGLNLL